MPHATKALFTLDEANRALPLVRAIATDLVAEFRALRTAGRERRALEAEGHGGARGERRAAMLAEAVHLASERVEGYLKELSALGLEMRDLELGLVDFPTLMGPEPAFLCWRLGEPTVAFWHSADKAHSERLPIAAAVATA
jgi:hypothetical protein